MPEVKSRYEKSSLPTALLRAGAAGVIAPLWAVDDRSAMLLMARRHQQLESGADPCAALRSAQR
jgi:CHAT domain-containing protein